VSFRTLGAWLTAGAAFWASLGALDVTSGGGGIVRVAMLPALGQLVACLLLAILLGGVLRFRMAGPAGSVPGQTGPRRASGRGDSFEPLYALGVLVLPYLPWLPDRLPVLRVFAGPGRLLVWLVVAAQVAWSVLGTAGRGRRFVVRMRAWTPARGTLAAGAAAALLFSGTALALAPSGFFPGGDEPHYLVMMQSLLKDGDLRIENNHAQRDYEAFFDGDLPPHAIAPGRNGAMYSVHPVGLPLIAAPFFAVGGYPAVVLLMILLAAAASGLAWTWARRITGSVSSATFAWAATTLSLPFLANAGTVFPEVPAALAVLAAVTAAFREEASGNASIASAGCSAGPWRALAVGLAAAALPWLHAKYAPLSAVLIAVGARRLWRDRPADGRAGTRLMVVAAAPYAASLAGWMAFHYAVWGSPWPSAPYGGASGTQMSAWTWIRGVPGLLADQEYGVLAYAPALAIAFLGVRSMWRAGGRARGVATDLSLLVAAMLATVGAFQMWWGGSSLPGRMLVSVIPLLAVPVAWEFRASAERPERRAAYRLLLIVGFALALAAVLARGGASLALTRNGISRLIEWLSPDWHLWAYAPDFIMQPAWVAWLQLAIWAACILACGWAVGTLSARRSAARGASRTGRGRAFLRADAGAFFALVLVTLLMPPALGSRLKENPAPEERTRIALLESFDPHARPIGVRYDPLSLVDAASLPGVFTLSARPGSRTARQPAPVLLNARFALPSGRYEVEIASRSPAALAGSLALQAGRSGGSLQEWSVAAGPGERWRATFDLPVDINYVGFRASDGLAPQVGELRIRPLRVVTNLDRVAASEVLASSAFSHYVFLFHDGAAYPEPAGFWVRGAGRAVVSVVSRTGRLATNSRMRLRLLSLIPNAVSVETPDRTWTVELEAGVASEIEIQPTVLDGTLRMALRPASGFRPSERTPDNPDRRFLGCWVELAEL